MNEIQEYINDLDNTPYEVVGQMIDKRLDRFNEMLESEECDCIDRLLYNNSIGTLEDLKSEILRKCIK